MLIAEDFNRLFRAGFEIMRENDKSKRLDGQILADVLTSPIFQFGVSTMIQNDWPESIAKTPYLVFHEGRIMAPYTMFRILHPPGDNTYSVIDKEGKVSDKQRDTGYAISTDHGDVLTMFKVISSPGETSFMQAFSFRFIMKDGVLQCDSNGLLSVDFNRRKVVQVTGDDDRMQREDIQMMLQTMINWIGVFLWNLNTPSTHVVKQTPLNQGKSIDWIKQRSRLLILDNHEVSELQNKILKKENLGYLTRASHPRRAHLKYLASAKWVNKQGTWVPVKEAWVGPEEWRDESAQVQYKLIKREK